MPSARAVADLSKFTVSAGIYHSVAIRDDFTVSAWGSNSNGQLGDGTTTDHLNPTQISGLTNVVAVCAGGGYSSLALKGDGTVWAWGYNGFGQLGDGTQTSRSKPVQVAGLSDIEAISLGVYHGLALKRDGTVWAWGFNANGEVGDGTTSVRTTPVQVSGLAGVTSIAAGGYHSLAVKADGTVWAWGFNVFGQLGDGTTTQRLTPVQVSGLTGAVSVAASSFYFSLAVKADGTAAGWGYNGHNQLGDGTGVNRSLPGVVPGLTGVVAVAAGSYHALALKGDGSVWGWGCNNNGQVGNGTTEGFLSPVQVVGISGAVTVAAGGVVSTEGDSMALLSDGTVRMWGYNVLGELGDGTTTRRPLPVQSGTLIAELGNPKPYPNIPYVPSMILVKPASSQVLNALATFTTTYGGVLMQTLTNGANDVGWQSLSIPSTKTVLQACHDFLASGLVQYAQPNHISLPNQESDPDGAVDPDLADGKQYHLYNIQAVRAFQESTDPNIQFPKVKTGMIIAVLDTGIRFSQEDFYGSSGTSTFWTNPGEVENDGIDNDNDGIVDDIHGVDYTKSNDYTSPTIRKDGHPDDFTGHGSSVAGTAAARGKNGVGGSGVCIKAKIMAVKVIFNPGNNTPEGSANDMTIKLGIDYAVAHGASVINLSLGYLLPKGDSIEKSGKDDKEKPTHKEVAPIVREAIANAGKAGVIVVCSAGNDGVKLTSGSVKPKGTNQDYFPATYDLDNIIVVASTDSDDKLLTSATSSEPSNYGDKVHLGAPGKAIRTIYANQRVFASRPDLNPDATYGFATGTSFAAPQVSGVICLLRTNYPSDDYRTTIARLLDHVDQVPDLQGKVIKNGRLNMYRALTEQ